MATYSSNLRLAKQATGENPNSWGATLNTGVFDLLDFAIAGMTSLSVAGGTEPVLTTQNGAPDQSRAMILSINGALGSNSIIQVPALSKVYAVNNATSGAFTLTVKTVTGTGAAVAQGATQWVWCDGTDVFGFTPNILASGSSSIAITTPGGVIVLTGNATISGTLGVTGLASFTTLATSGQATLNSVSVTGVSTLTGVVNAGNAVNWVRGADVASAATTDLDAMTGNSAHLTGSATITAFTHTDGCLRLLEIPAASAPVITNNASVAVQGGANYTCSPGDILLIVRDDTVSRVTILRTTGTPVFPSMTLLSSQAAAASAQIDFTGIDSTYDEYELHIVNARPATNAAVGWVRVSTDAGATYKAGATDYDTAQAAIYSDGTVSPNKSNTGDTQIYLTDPAGVSNASDGKLDGVVRLIKPSSASGKSHLQFNAAYDRDGGLMANTSGCGRTKFAAAAYNAVRFLFSTGAITSGTFKLYGIRK